MYKATITKKLSKGLEGDELSLFQEAASLVEEADGKTLAQTLTSLREESSEVWQGIIDEAFTNSDADLNQDTDNSTKKKKVEPDVKEVVKEDDGGLEEGDVTGDPSTSSRYNTYGPKSVPFETPSPEQAYQRGFNDAVKGKALATPEDWSQELAQAYTSGYESILSPKNESYSDTIKSRIEELESIDSIYEGDEPEGLSIQEDVDAMFEGAEISEEFKEKAKTIFEAAVARQVSAYKELVNESIDELVEEEIQAITEELTERIDQYLDYVVEEWVEENQIGIEMGLRTEISEGFIAGLKNLFLENYIEVPEGREDILVKVSEEKIELEEEFENAVQKNLDLIAEIKELKREIIVSELSKDLVDTQAEKLAELSEGVIFESVDDFLGKVSHIKESYFSQKPQSTKKPVILHEEEIIGAESVITDSKMAKYANALDKFK